MGIPEELFERVRAVWTHDMNDVLGALVIIGGVVMVPIMIWRGYLLVRYIIPSKERWTAFVKAAAEELGLSVWLYHPGPPEDFNVLASDDFGVELSLQRGFRGFKTYSSGTVRQATFHIVLRFASADQDRLAAFSAEVESLAKAFEWVSRSWLDKGTLDLVYDATGLSIVVYPPCYRLESDERLRELFRTATKTARTILQPNDLARVHRHLRILDVWHPDRLGKRPSIK